MRIRLLSLLAIPILLACNIATLTPTPSPTRPPKTGTPKVLSSRTPTITPTPSEYVTVLAETLEVRACPSESCRTLGYFHEGDKGRVLARDRGDGLNCSEWIVLLRPELVGWVCADWVE